MLNGQNTICGLNDWKMNEWDVQMTPATTDAEDYFFTEFEVPELAYGMNFVFSADGNFENSGGDNFFVDTHYGKTMTERRGRGRTTTAPSARTRRPLAARSMSPARKTPTPKSSPIPRRRR